MRASAILATATALIFSVAYGANSTESIYYGTVHTNGTNVASRHSNATGLNRPVTHYHPKLWCWDEDEDICCCPDNKPMCGTIDWVDESCCDPDELEFCGFCVNEKGENIGECMPNGPWPGNGNDNDKRGVGKEVAFRA